MSRRRQDDPPPKKEPSFSNSSMKDALSKFKAANEPKAVPKAPPGKAPASPPKIAPKPWAPPPPPPKQGKRTASEEAEDFALFRMAMDEVAPIRRASKDSFEPAPSLAPTLTEVNEEAEALAQLSELVATGEGIELAQSAESVEGSAPGIDASLLKHLRRGDFSVQASVDLDGLAPEAARAELEKCLTESRRRGHRCVLVVHGRGLPAKEQLALIRSRMSAWLSRGRLARIVLALATARAVDGGAGALYLLLRR